MGSLWLTSIFMILLFSSCSLILAQQPYTGSTTSGCTNEDNSSSGLGYFCNGVNRSCQTYLTFISQPPYNTVPAISTFLASDPSQLAQINSVLENATFPTNRMVLVPVNCSCSGTYYQANTSYVVRSNDNYITIANNTFEALSTCQALQNQNIYQASSLPAGVTITVPLRCACPTQNQSDSGVKYLLTYRVSQGDTLDAISSRFSVRSDKIKEANELPSSNIDAVTTILIPLQVPPTSSEMMAPPPPPPPPASPPPPAPPSNNSSSKTWIYVLVGVLGGIALLVFVAILFYVFFWRGNKKSDSINVSDHFEARKELVQKEVELESAAFLESISSVAHSLKVYNFRELQLATDDFSPSSLINGSVYRAKINGDLAAIKKMNGDVSEEINLLNMINHFNIIRLSGVCFNDGLWYLIYEYASNGPLSDWIYNSSSDEKPLSWTQRIQILLDIATGLSYLHGFTTPPHVHKDIKSSNILLDGDFRAKIVNFGQARSAEGDRGQFSLTKHIIGTRGYMAPEYLEHGFISTKLDVYAFGVLMLETVTGKEVAALYEEENMQLSDVLDAVLREDGQENLGRFMDHSLQGNYPSDLAVFLVRLIDSCLRKDPAARPAMDEIEQSLSRTLHTSLTCDFSKNM